MALKKHAIVVIALVVGLVSGCRCRWGFKLGCRITAS
jgi:hypothetical protein